MKIKIFISLLVLILILSFTACSIPLNQTVKVTTETIKENNAAQTVKETETITTVTETTEPKPELKILNVNGQDADCKNYPLNGDTIDGNITIVLVNLEINNFNVNKDTVQTIWEYENSEVFRSNDIKNDTANKYYVGAKSTEGFFTTGNYKCTVSINNSIEQSIEFKITQKDLEPIEISGKGSKSTDFFDISGGLTIFEFNNSGSGNFITYLLDKDGNEIELLSNVIGSAKGRKAMYVPSGKYFINVKMGGTWKFTVYQPRSLKTTSIPYTFTGNSPDISSLFIADQLIEANYSFSGNGNLVVYLLNQNGEQQELLVNEIGNTSGSTTIKGDGNKYLISVELANGKYEINLDYKK
jgi:hypothetical protein